jgi:hypothetical protein
MRVPHWWPRGADTYPGAASGERWASGSMLTGSRFARAVSANGAEFVALPEEADCDDRNPDESFPTTEENVVYQWVGHRPIQPVVWCGAACGLVTLNC